MTEQMPHPQQHVHQQEQRQRLAPLQFGQNLKNYLSERLTSVRNSFQENKGELNHVGDIAGPSVFLLTLLSEVYNIGTLSNSSNNFLPFAINSAVLAGVSGAVIVREHIKTKHLKQADVPLIQQESTINAQAEPPSIDYEQPQAQYPEMPPLQDNDTI